jgi:hypothetical protein
MSRLLNALSIRDSAFDPNSSERVIYYRHFRSAGRDLYKVWLYLEGPSLPFVKKVKYILHPTFPKPERTVTRTMENPNCQLIIWTWGFFTVKAMVEDKQGNQIFLEHYLTYRDQLDDPNKDLRKVKYADG